MSACRRRSQQVDATLYLKRRDGGCCDGSERFVADFTAAEKTEMWDRWQRGESLSSIGRAFGKESSSIYFQISPYGGDPAGATAALAAGLDAVGTRDDISRDCGPTIGPLDGRQLGRSPSTVSREIKRNGGCDRYRAAQCRRIRPGPRRAPEALQAGRAIHGCGHDCGVKLTTELWSPEQIAGWLKRAYPGERNHQVSHETIYRSLFVQARGVLKKS